MRGRLGCVRSQHVFCRFNVATWATFPKDVAAGPCVGRRGIAGPLKYVWHNFIWEATVTQYLRDVVPLIRFNSFVPLRDVLLSNHKVPGPDKGQHARYSSRKFSLMEMCMKSLSTLSHGLYFLER